jgi:hypothetical protein
MKRIVLTESEAVSYPEIAKLYELTAEEIENCYIRDLFECDPDYFNWGVHGLYKLPFVELLDKYIIIPDDNYIEAITDYKLSKLSDKCKLMLVNFFEDNFKDYFTSVESTWKSFNGLNFGVAFRGGAGYSYAIWKYNNKR